MYTASFELLDDWPPYAAAGFDGVKGRGWGASVSSENSCFSICFNFLSFKIKLYYKFNFFAILEQGLQLAPKLAYVNPCMYGYDLLEFLLEISQYLDIDIE